MSVLAAFMVPHPPLIVPDIGKGSEKKVQKTIDSYERVAKEIAALSPDTIVISSPHSVMYYDYFHISPGEKTVGDFSMFDAPQVSFSESYDSELVKEIEKIAESENFPAGTKAERNPSLDHGTMVPLYFIRKAYKGGKIVRVGLSGLSYEAHYRLGEIIKEASQKLNRKIVFVASGDLSHKLQEYGPYGFAKEGPEYDERIMDVCSRAAFGELFDFDEDFCSRAAECGHRSFVIMAGVLDGILVKATKYSHEDITGVGYGICSFYPMGEKKESDDKTIMRSMDESDEYVKLARKTIETFIKENIKICLPNDLPKDMTDKRAGAFVSIHKYGQLRGCIGTILPTTGCVGEEIIQNAISASTSDPRFPAITENELSALEISVDVLGEPEDIPSPDYLDVKKYGVIVTKGFKRGLLLPDLDGVDTVEDQIAIAKRKAGIGYDEDVKLQRFEVIRHH